MTLCSLAVYVTGWPINAGFADEVNATDEVALLTVSLSTDDALPLTRLAYDRLADLLYAWNRRKRRW